MTDTLGFWDLAQEQPDRLAIAEANGREVTYGELLASANRLVHGLRDHGLSEGDAIATVLPNTTEMFALYFAAMQAGWYLTPINHHLVGAEIAYIVDDSEAAALISHERVAEACADAAGSIALSEDRCFAIGDVAGHRPFDDLVAGQSAEMPDDRSAGAPMHYTSGTTGKPKGVRRPLSGGDPDAAAARGSYLLNLFGIEPYDDGVHLCGSPLYHTAVLAYATTLTARRTHRRADGQVVSRGDARTDRAAPGHAQPHGADAVPSTPRPPRGDQDPLRPVLAAAPCPVDVKQRMLDWWGPVIYEYYAATEGGGTLVTPEQWLERPGTVGLPWPNSEIRILDDDGQDVPTGEVGTVYMKLGLATFEYFKDKTKTDSNRRAGFFTVGDIGYLDEAGFLFLCDRKSDMIISGGVNIYPAEIEGELLGHPAVADAAVFGIPHDDWGEEIKAVIEPVAGTTPGDELAAELLEHCRARLAKFKLPKSIDFVTEMPRDPNGKLYKRKLRDPYGRDASGRSDPASPLRRSSRTRPDRPTEAWARFRRPSRAIARCRLGRNRCSPHDPGRSGWSR